jgi:hypothetical protein
MFIERGCAFTPETVRAGEARVVPLIRAHLRAKRPGKAGQSRRWAETWCADF